MINNYYLRNDIKLRLILVFLSLLMIFLFNASNLIISWASVLLLFSLVLLATGNLVYQFFLFVIFYCTNSSLAFVLYRVNDIKSTLSNISSDSSFYFAYLVGYYIFSICLILFLKIPSKLDLFKTILSEVCKYSYSKRKLAWFLSLLLTIFILIHVNYVPINNNTIYIESTLNKYSAHMYLPLSILFILSISFTGWARRLAIVVFVIISGLFILMILKSGNRAAVIPIVILIIIYFFEKNGKLNFFKMLIYFLLIFLSLYILVFIGLFRSNPNIDLLSIDTSNLIFKKLFILETAQAAFYSTVTSIQVSQIMSFSFWDFIKGIFVGGSSISYITNSIIPNIGGSVFPIYFVFYFKWFGTVFSGLSLVFVINYLSRSNQSSITKYILLMVLINVFDWYLYSPFVLIRGCIISGFIVIWFIIIFLKVRITK